MPDKKITDLVDGDPLQPTDEFVVARGGDNFKIDGAAVVDAATAAVTKHDVTLAGNTAGALALISSGTMSLAGGNNITLSQAGNAVTISGGAGGAETQTAISGISASDALYTSGTVRFTGVGGGVTVSSNTGQRVDISVAAPVAQTVQTQNVHNVTLSGNTAGALAEISSGTLTLAGGNNITVSQAGNAVTISGPNVGGAQTGISAIANSETTYTSGSVTLSALGAVTIRSTTGQHFQISVNSQSVQPETQTFIAGVSASDTLYTSGNVRITGVGGGVTVSSNTGQRVDISVAAQSVQPETQTFIAGVSASDTLYTSGNVRITGVGGGITVSSNTGQRIDLSVAAQSVQPETQTFIGGISASNTLYTSGSVRFTGSQAVTVRSGTGQLVVIDAPAQSVQPETQTFIAGVSASDTLYTSGNVRITGVGGGVTVSSNTGQRIDISVAAPVAQTAQTGISGIANSQTTYTSGTVSLSELGAITIRSTTGNQYQLSVNSQTVQTQGVLSAGVSTGGNTVGNTTVNTGSRFVLVASGNATASQATAAGASTVTISVGTQTVQTQGVPSLGVSTGGNTSGDTTVNSGTRLVFAGGNNITLSQGTAANATTITISGPNVGGAQTGISGIANSQTTYTSGTVSLSELGAITIRSTTGNQYQLSVNSQTVQTQGILSMGVSTGGNTAGNTTVNTGSRFVIVGSNGITASQGTAAGATTVTLSGITQSVQTNDIPRLGVSTGGNTAGDTTVNSGTRLVFVGTNNITLSQGTAASATTITISGPTTAAQTVQTQGILNVALSNIGNTAGDTGINSGTRYVLAGGNNVTLSGSSAANATTVTISAANQTVQTQGILSAGVSNVGNTSGNTTVNTGSRFVLAGGNNITLSQSTAAGATTITVSAPNLGAGAFSGGVSTGGNTAGATGITGTQNVFVGVSPMSLSQTTGANGGTISILAPATSSLSATGIVSLSTNGSTISVGAPAYSGGMSTMGNTAGDTGYASQRLNLAGGNNITLSGSTNGGSMTITISGGAGGAETQTAISGIANSQTTYTSGTVSLSELGAITIRSTTGNQFQLSVNSQTVQTQNVHNVTLSGNTAGAMAHISSGTMTLAGGNGITLSQAGNAVTISGGGGGAGFSAGVSTGGNTAGATGITGTQLVLVGGSNISLSQTTGANGGTVSFNAPASSSLSATGLVSIAVNGSTISIGAKVDVDDWQNFPVAMAGLMTHATGISKTPFYWHDNLPGNITAKSLIFRVSNVTASQPNSFSAHLGVYTLVNSTSAALLGSVSEAYVVSSASSVSFSAIRNYAITGIGTHTALSTLSAGHYMFGMMLSASATNVMNLSLMGAGSTGGPLGVIFPGTNQMSTGTSQGIQALYGRGSTTVNAMPANVVASELVNQGQGASMQLQPWIYIRS